MTTKAFVTACRGPDYEPCGASPLTWLLTAINSLDDLDTAIAERDEDPDAHNMMVNELRSLHRGLLAAMAQHDAGLPGYGRPLAERISLSRDLSPEALDAVEQLRRLDFPTEISQWQGVPSVNASGKHPWECEEEG